MLAVCGRFASFLFVALFFVLKQPLLQSWLHFRTSGRASKKRLCPLFFKTETRVGPAWDPRGLECQNQLVYYAYVLPGVTVGFPSGIIR